MEKILSLGKLISLESDMTSAHLSACTAAVETTLTRDGSMQHYKDIIEDQFDFHQYCLRKVTLRAYIEMLRFVDTIYGQKVFLKAAKLIVRVS